MVFSVDDVWSAAVLMAKILISLVASAHVVLYKRDVRAVIGWVGMIWLAPIAGTILYVILGVNRIRRRAQALWVQPHGCDTSAVESMCRPQHLDHVLGADNAHLDALVTLVQTTTHRPLLPGNELTPLINGDETYPAMLDAIDGAETSIACSTYIFDNDAVGRLIVDAFGRAVERGVAVRVLIDDVGARYSWPTIVAPLRRAGVRVVRFLPTLVPWLMHYSNLRNHRKILVIDGTIGFTGGLNLRAGHCLQTPGRHHVQDLHFRLTGPVVEHLQRVFADDWAFAAGERLVGDDWFPKLTPTGPMLARGISDGPDVDLDKLRLTMLGAIACARRSLSIVTPYFLPDAALITALNVAAMRGVQVRIVLPERNNLILVQWACMAQLWQVLEHGCRVWLSPPPFDHSKLMVVDDLWTLIGSVNWDPRSLRLNFEFNVECYDQEFAAATGAMIEERIKRSRQVTLADVASRSLPVKLRDATVRMFAPFL